MHSRDEHGNRVVGAPAGLPRSISGTTQRCSWGQGLALFTMVAAVLASAGCGGGSDSQMPNEQAANEPARLGCGAYCQQAGGYGGGSTAPDMVRIDTTSPVASSPDGTVPITMTCLFRARCEGAVLLTSGSYRIPPGRSDLVVAGRSSRTLAVPLSDVQREALQKEGQIKVVVTADVFPSLETLPTSERDEWNAVIPKAMMVSAPRQ
jgi:hypothetical protein